ncbi:hypothetical protein Btru_046178 [Bulinus truncatus]|nr:hypothetical protein Btru_046178 [Bulinus truncatus]
MESKKGLVMNLDRSEGYVKKEPAVKKPITKSSQLLLQTIEPGDEKCISDLRSVIEALRVEITCLMEKQQKDLMDHFNIQKIMACRRDPSERFVYFGRLLDDYLSQDTTFQQPLVWSSGWLIITVMQ